MLKFVGIQPLEESLEFNLSNTIVEMGKIYGSTVICPPEEATGKMINQTIDLLLVQIFPTLHSNSN